MAQDAVARIESASQLSSIGEDIRRDAYRLPAVYLRGPLAETIVSLLHSGSSVLLRGEPGVGKTALARSLANARWPGPKTEVGQLRLVEVRGAHVPLIIETNPGRFVEGCYYAHDLENKLGKLLAGARARSAILFIDNVEQCIGLGSSTSDPQNDVANLLLPHIDRGLQILGATTPEGEARLRVQNPRLLDRFTIVEVQAPDYDESCEIARMRFSAIERAGSRVTSGAVREALDLAARFFPAEPPLGACLRLAERAAATASLIDATTLRRAVAEDLGIRPELVGIGRLPTHPEMVASLEAEVFEQEEAVGEVADAVGRYAVGLCEVGRPVASFLFAGPSGCGKTSLALATAELVTGSRSSLIRLDMSEYSDPYAPKRLLEDTESSLVGQLLSRRAGVILFDEIEKAHPLVITLLLQALGEARLTSVGGRTVRLDHYFVLLTTNVGSRRWAIGRSVERTVPLVLSDVSEAFPPEFRARLTRNIVFAPLGVKATHRIVARELDELNEMPGIVERGLQIVWGGGLAPALGAFGVSTERGARGVQTVVRSVVTTALARWLAEHPEARDGVVMVAPRIARGALVSLSIEWVDDARFFDGVAN